MKSAAFSGACSLVKKNCEKVCSLKLRQAANSMARKFTGVLLLKAKLVLGIFIYIYRLYHSISYIVCLYMCLSTAYTSAVSGVYACVSKFDQEHACTYLNVRLCAHDCCWCEASYRSYRQESN